MKWVKEGRVLEDGGNEIIFYTDRKVVAFFFSINSAILPLSLELTIFNKFSEWFIWFHSLYPSVSLSGWSAMRKKLFSETY